MKTQTLSLKQHLRAVLTQDKDSLVHNGGMESIVLKQCKQSLSAEHVSMFSLSHISVHGSPLLLGDRDE